MKHKFRYYSTVLPRDFPCHRWKLVYFACWSYSIWSPSLYAGRKTLLIFYFSSFDANFPSLKEIYNENVYDLLTPSKTDRGLKVREHPKKGFYGIYLFVFIFFFFLCMFLRILKFLCQADGLSNFVVTSYADIERLIKHGTLNRLVQNCVNLCLRI